MISWHVETRKISRLKRHKSNPRRLSKEQHAHLQISLDKFGLIDEPICNVDGSIIAGHQRIRILKSQGVKEVPCKIPDRELTQKEVDELLIRHNKNIGTWDDDILANEWELVDLFEYGFTADELELDDEDKAPAEKKEKTCPNCGEPVK